VLDDAARQSVQPQKEIELLRGLCAWHQSRPERARQILSQALQSFPEDVELQQSLEILGSGEGAILPVSAEAISFGQ
jgi:hypothetical protein